MALTKLRDELGGLLHNGLHRHDGHRSDLDRLLDALERKDAALQQQLAGEKAPLKRHHLKIQLKVTRLQHRKGVARRLAAHPDAS